ncbi:hypothetical protein MVEN_00076000 [Mycena venus]|uniref:RNase H type-1 domain-containing protein n=1 Tax=Mycena venus TaxID=2733690 RepID=A0A8H6Z7S7_9AGAR|nr:hypothetical protein MVEN_00076000 [Mycena venus]
MRVNGLRQCVKAGTPTFYSPVHHTTSTIDLVFISDATLGKLLEKCVVLPGHGSDHSSISCSFAIPLEHHSPPPRRNFRGADWDAFPELLESYLSRHPLPLLPLLSPTDIDAYVDALTAAVTTVLEAHVPLTRMSPYTRRWWNASLTALRRAYNVAHHAIQKDDPADPSWKMMRAARNRYHSAIRRAKRAHWREYICELPRGNIWKAAKYALDPGSMSASSRIPDLVAPDGSIASTPCRESKSPAREILPAPLPGPLFTLDDIHRAISKLSPWKAPGPSGIPNIAISSARTIFAPILLSILEAGLRIGYFPRSWRVFLTVTIRKPGKSDYTLPGAHRPIAEEECLGKVVESVVTEWLSGLAEKHGLLSPNQFGGRPGRYTVDALLQLVQRVKDAWRVGKVASLLLMDISQAFPSSANEFPLPWCACSSFLSERSTRLVFDDHVSEPSAVPNGLPQGSPLSALLYLIFADEFLADGTSGYIDDNSRLETLLFPVPNGLASSSTSPKFQLVHFVSPRRHRDHYRAMPMRIGSITIEASTTAKLLGVILDNKLTFRNHVELAQSRGTKAVLALSPASLPLPSAYRTPTSGNSSSRSSSRAWSMRFQCGIDQCRRGRGARRAGTVWVAKALGKVQRQACKMITGALRTTATDTLDFHANLLPVHIRLNRSAFNAAARLATLPASNPIRRIFQRCRRVPRFHRSPIHHLIAAFPAFLHDFETIDPQRRIIPLPAGALTTRIAQTKDDACADMEGIVAKGGFCIFTDGSGFEGGVGAAAVAMKGLDMGETRQKYLGTEGEHTVFESEVCGAILALDIIAGTPRLTNVDLFMDCQPAIIALSSPKPQPGQYLLAAFHALLGRLLRARRTLKIRIHWVPAHIGIEGNEAVDARAKEAAVGMFSPLASRISLFESPLPSSKAAAVASGSKASAARWLAEWSLSPRFSCIAAFDSALPSKAVARPYSELSRPRGSILTQLRTGHIGLNAYLHRFNLTPSPNCHHCGVPESVPHFLLICPAYHAHRLCLISRLGTARLSLRCLISTKADPGPVLAFVHNTGRFPLYAL